MNKFFDKIISLTSLENIAGLFERLISLIAFLIFLIIPFVAIGAIINGDGFGGALFVLVVGPLAWVLSFGTLAMFIKIYQHVKSIDNKLG